MKTKPLVSFITPTFNRASFLIQTIESVINQDYPNIEHIIVDDGSTDDTRKEIKRYIDNDKVRYFYQENSGQSVARNVGLKEAKGEFICFLDSDDLALPDRVSSSLEALLQSPTADVVYGDYSFIDAEGNEIPSDNMQRFSGTIYKKLLNDNCISMNTTMVKAEVIHKIGGFLEHIKVADDYDLWLRLSVKSKFLYLPKELSVYRLMEMQLSSDKKARFESNEEIIRRFLKSNATLFNRQECAKHLSNFYNRAARHFSNTGDEPLARSYLLKSIKTKAISTNTCRTFARYFLNLFKK